MAYNSTAETNKSLTLSHSLNFYCLLAKTTQQIQPSHSQEENTFFYSFLIKLCHLHMFVLPVCVRW